MEQQDVMFILCKLDYQIFNVLCIFNKCVCMSTVTKRVAYFSNLEDQMKSKFEGLPIRTVIKKIIVLNITVWRKHSDQTIIFLSCWWIYPFWDTLNSKICFFELQRLKPYFDIWSRGIVIKHIEKSTPIQVQTSEEKNLLSF